MKTYKVIYKETLVHTFYVEENSCEEAEQKFKEQSMACELDFSYGEIDETEYIIEEDN